MNREWNLIRSIIAAANDPEDLRDYADLIENSSFARAIAADLRTFASQIATPKHSVGLSSRRQSRSNPRMRHNIDDRAIALQSIFRDELFMSNLEVQDWLFRTYGVSRPINKEALATYLHKVLSESNTDLYSQIVEVLRGRLAHEGGWRADIQEFSDRLDDFYSK